MLSFSVPGKALLAGGYLVLDPDYSAYVVALSSRMYAVVKQNSPTADGSTLITVSSPQFTESTWRYAATKSEVKALEGKNPFVESTIRVLMAFFKITGVKIEIEIYSDASYHSQDETEIRVSKNGKKSLLYHKRPITQVSKTGMGSSAGLVTVLTTALYSAISDNPSISSSLQTIHNLAQIAHCLAQGKVGSGFDVAAAAFGSIVYRRFHPHVINPVIGQLSSLNAECSDELRRVVTSDWKVQTSRCALPGRIRLLMGDISGGSETPKLVSKVLNWRSLNATQADALWSELNGANMSLVKSLEDLHELQTSSPEEYTTMVDFMSTHTIDEVNFQPLCDVANAFKCIRKALQELTRCTGAEIEPPQQTALLNKCNAMKGVLGGVVPGAGGYDAICLLVVEDVIPEIIGGNLDSVNWLDLREQDSGIMVEDAQDFVF